jgi:hypothetical protein
VERCPACLGQALGCPCFGASDDDLEDDLDELDDLDECMSLELASRRARAGVDVGVDVGDDIGAHVRLSSRCRAHLFHRYFRR